MEATVDICETIVFVCIKILESVFHGISLYFDFYLPSRNYFGNKSNFIIS